MKALCHAWKQRVLGIVERAGEPTGLWNCISVISERRSVGKRWAPSERYVVLLYVAQIAIRHSGSEPMYEIQVVSVGLDPPINPWVCVFFSFWSANILCISQVVRPTWPTDYLLYILVSEYFSCIKTNFRLYNFIDGVNGITTQLQCVWEWWVGV